MAKAEEKYEMEKLGIANSDLVKELKEQYKKLKEDEATMYKTGSILRPTVLKEMAAVKEKIDELEEKDGGTAS